MIVTKNIVKLVMVLVYRQLNEQLIKWYQSLASVEENFDILEESCFSSFTEMSGGFHQTPVEVKSQDSTAFSGPSS